MLPTPTLVKYLPSTRAWWVEFGPYPSPDVVIIFYPDGRIAEYPSVLKLNY